jgi:hypothetical protein
LASPFGLSFSDGYIYNLQEYDNNYRNVYAQSTDEEFASLDASMTLHEAATVTGGEPILETQSTAKLSSDREAQALTVAAQSGNVVAIGDTSIFDSEWVQRNDNEEFVGSVIEFLATSDKEPGEPSPPENAAGPSSGGVTR